MAHPHAEHRAHSASRKRVGHLLKSGGHAHSDAAADKKLFTQLIKQHEAKEHDVHGEKHGGRIGKYARGGVAKKHGNHVNIAIVAPHGRHPDPGAMPGGAGPALPMGGPPVGGPPPALPPGGGLAPAGGPPGLMPRPGMVPPMKRGGRVKMTAGAMSGEGRLEKRDIQKRKRRG